MFSLHIYTEVEHDEPVTGDSVQEVIKGYDLTQRNVENVFELAGGDIAIVDKEPDEEPGGYEFLSVSRTANYANIAARVMEAFGEDMSDRSRVFDAARIGQALRENRLYVFPLCNPFLDLLVSAMTCGGLSARQVSDWITGFACRESYKLYDDTTKMDVRAGGLQAVDLYDFYVAMFGRDKESGVKRLADEIARCTRIGEQ